MDDDDCSKDAISHSVLIVGYGSALDARGVQIEYWVFKNSYGTGWGEAGFARIKMLTEDVVGLESTVAKGGYGKLLGTSFYAPIFETDFPCETIPSKLPDQLLTLGINNTITWPLFESSCNVTYNVYTDVEGQVYGNTFTINSNKVGVHNMTVEAVDELGVPVNG